jgi:tripartite-type tricarboxylate transporter receptor subunit TctC
MMETPSRTDYSTLSKPLARGGGLDEAGAIGENRHRESHWERGEGRGRMGRMLLTRRVLLHGMAAAAAAPAHAQGGAAPTNWPTRPLRIIIPTAPGGSPDLVARTLGSKLTERFGQPVLVESITQGIGVVGNQMVSRSAPDGHTLAMLTGGFTTQAAVMKSLPYDPLRDFAFVTTVVSYPMLLLVAPDSPLRSLEDLIARAKAAPGKVSYGILGGGSVYHLLGKWIENRAGIDMVAVPYRGSVPAFTDLVGGRLEAMLDTATSAITRIRNGQVRALAVSSPERYPLTPDTPTMASTLPSIELMSWLGLAAPAQTPAAIVARLNEEIRRALALADIKHWLTETGVQAAPCTPDEFRQRIEREIALYTRIADANGIRAE